MNIALRTAHGIAITLIGTTLPALLTLALLHRPERRDIESLAIDPAVIGDSSGVPGARIESGVEGVSLFALRDDASREYEVRATFGLREPDVLAYASRDAGSGPRLPADARLQGSVIPGRVLALRLDANERDLVLYSLGHQKILGHLRLRTAAAPDEKR